VTETLRYRGAIGQWSWVLHRITGLGVVLFLTLHVIDTSWAVFYPELYVKAIAVYQSPLFTIGEFALVACVVYHALNGIRIALFDVRPVLWKHQARAAVIVLILTILILIPVFALMFGHVLNFYNSGRPILPLGQVLQEQLPFVAGFVAAGVTAIVFAAITQLIVREPADKRVGKGRMSQVERFWWSFMRLSGVLIIPLVFGHLIMMHVLQGVFDITAANSAVVATGGAVNASGTSVEFVADRWNHLVAGVAIWRIYDIALLATTVLHGFNGLRYVLTDYHMGSPLLRRASVYLCVIAVIVLLAVGGLALVGTIDQTAIEMAQEAAAELGVAH
jgi:succinate dehydrogenase / fumarate reductase cytochrome b subunit